MSELQIRCTVTRYGVDTRQRFAGTLAESTFEQTTRAEMRGEYLYLYLGDSAPSARLAELLAGAREGRGWDAQVGTPPVYVEGGDWRGRNWPKIRVEADALLELEREINHRGLIQFMEGGPR